MKQNLAEVCQKGLHEYVKRKRQTKFRVPLRVPLRIKSSQQSRFPRLVFFGVLNSELLIITQHNTGLVVAYNYNSYLYVRLTKWRENCIHRLFQWSDEDARIFLKPLNYNICLKCWSSPMLVFCNYFTKQFF